MTVMPIESTDATLMQEVQHGSRIALGELYGRFAPRAYRAAMSSCHDPECAQDAVQDAFLSIWSSRASYRPETGPVVNWAMSIVRHRAVYLARRRWSAAPLYQGTAALEEQPAGDDVPRDCQRHAEAEQLVRLLGHLPPAQRQVIQLAFFDGLTHREIAGLLALPSGTVKGRMRLGLRKLRSELEGE